MKKNILDNLKELVKESGWSESLDNQYNQLTEITEKYKNHGLDLKLTCGACPEQYEVFKDGKQVAYYRLRHGYFIVELEDCGGEMIYEAYPKGDGIFDDDERIDYMNIALNTLLISLSNGNNPD